MFQVLTGTGSTSKKFKFEHRAYVKAEKSPKKEHESTLHLWVHQNLNQIAHVVHIFSPSKNGKVTGTILNLIN
jgi:ribulose-5-phosphate 4-epimerase/fuculose-1-phosphate aldolase